MVIRGVTFHVAPGEVVAAVGPNGVGKSTLLLAAAGLLPCATGSIEWKHPGRPRAYGVSGLLLQGGRVFPSLTVAENLAVAARHLAPSQRVERIRALEDGLPILTTAARQVAGTLSGGERQALALAMVLVQQPPLLLLDEPAAGVDTASAERIAQLLITALDAWTPAVLMVEHRAALVTRCATRILQFAATPDDRRSQGSSAQVAEGGSWVLATEDRLSQSVAPDRSGVMTNRTSR
ncbi:MAG: ATP-binding cassette domain-containing protein [Gemmatimonadetes bacterium]|nr:ATP-binding cassette domain-containing protein [Gemmatimonadota bacterium]